VNEEKGMNKFQQLASDAQFACVILANGGNVELVELDLRQPAEETLRAFAGRGDFLGVAAIVDGRPKVALTDVPDDETHQAAVQAFTKRVVDRIKRSRWMTEPARGVN
jgi:hypothetical protein